MNSLAIILNQHPWISIIIFGVIQGWIFLNTLQKLNRYKTFFPKDWNWRADLIENTYQIETPSVSVEATEFVREVNDYLAKNEGTTDFGIIKDKTERKLETLYEYAMSKISYPTLLGLTGTFFGVLIGLTSFKIGIATSGVTDAIISELLGGIIISMVTSFVGLILMMVGNSIATSYQKKVEIEKNKFYDFLQVELMPFMGTSMVSALHRLQQTIHTFEPAFRGIIGEFKAAFGECTKTLHDSFGENVKQLTAAADTMSKHLALINENVQKQDELLKTLRQKETLITLEKFSEAAQKFESVTTSIGELNYIKNNIASSSEQLVKAQSDYIKQMTIPERVFDKVNDILKRITTFEDNINALGINISQTQLLGNTQMNLIEEQISAIQKKTNLAVRYQEITDEQLKNIYEEQSKVINAINAQYRQAIQNHGEDFKDAMSEFKTVYQKIVNDCKLVIEEKRDDFIQEIKKSIDLEAKNQHLAQLAKIPLLLETLSTISDSVKDPSAVLSKIDDLKIEIRKNVSSSGLNGGGAFKGATLQTTYVGVSHLGVPAEQAQVDTSPAKRNNHKPKPKRRSLFGFLFKRKQTA